MTRQEAYDRMLAHMRNQKAFSLESSTTCVYRHPCGHKCAVGALIPDEAYDPGFEGSDATDKDVVLAASMNPEDAIFLNDAQDSLHDSIAFDPYNMTPKAFNPETFECNAKDFAERWKLTYTPPAQSA